MSFIKPTIGRQVWFRGIPWANGAIPVRLDANQPMAATIVYVHNDRSVNLVVIDHAGTPWPVHSVTLVHPGDDIDPDTAHAEWMPYQVAQAKPLQGMSNIFVGVQQPLTNQTFERYTPLTNLVGKPLEVGSTTVWPALQPNITMASETLAGTGQLSARPQ